MPAKSTQSAPKKRREWRPAFLEAFERYGTVSAACKAAGIERSTAYKARQRDEDFAVAWHEAEEAATDGLESEAIRRAHDGSDTLLIFLLKSRRPAIYREHYRPQPTRPAREHPTQEEFDREIEELIEQVRRSALEDLPEDLRQQVLPCLRGSRIPGNNSAPPRAVWDEQRARADFT